MSWTSLNRLLFCPAETLVYTLSLSVPSSPRGLCGLTRAVRKAEIWGPKKQLPGTCMARNRILESNTHSPEIASRYPQDNVVIAVPKPLCCCGKAAVWLCMLYYGASSPGDLRCLVGSMWFLQVSLVPTQLGECCGRAVILCRFRLRTVKETQQKLVSNEHTPTDKPNPQLKRNLLHDWGQNFGEESRTRRY